jgi:hypothetical protein
MAKTSTDKMRQMSSHLPLYARAVVWISFLILFVLPAMGWAASCEIVAKNLNAQLNQQLDERELAEVLTVLNKTKNRRLPPKFVTKEEAKKAGWRPGMDLWAIDALKGKSIGGDYFGNFDQRLPKGRWREADLDYRGGKRGPKRIVFATDGRRLVTIDHYQTFVEVPPCQ